MQKKVPKDEALEIIEDESEEEVEGLRRCVELHSMSVNVSSVEEMLSWIRSTREFKKRDYKSKNKDTRNILMARVN